MPPLQSKQLHRCVQTMILTKPSDQFPTDAWLKQVFSDYFDPCPLNYKPEIDGLLINWGERTYVNPPYSNVLPWVLKAVEEHNKGKTVVMLLKLDPTTQWYRALQEAGAHFFWCGERLHHGAKYASPFPSMLVILSTVSGE